MIDRNWNPNCPHTQLHLSTKSNLTGEKFSALTLVSSSGLHHAPTPPPVDWDINQVAGRNSWKCPEWNVNDFVLRFFFYKFRRIYLYLNIEISNKYYTSISCNILYFRNDFHFDRKTLIWFLIVIVVLLLFYCCYYRCKSKKRLHNSRKK